MRNEAEIKIIKDLKSDGKSFQQIADIMKLPRGSVTHLYYQDSKTLKTKRGSKRKMTSFEKLRMQRQEEQYKKNMKKV